MRWLATLLALMLVLLTGHSTSADRRKVRQAKREFYQGNTQYRLGNFDNALAHFRRSLELANRPNTVFNIAQCYRHLKQPKQALFYYWLYLSEWERAKPGTKAPHHQEVKERIAELEAEAARARAALEQRERQRRERERREREQAENDRRKHRQAGAELSTGEQAGAVSMVGGSSTGADSLRRRRLWTWIIAGSAAVVGAVGVGVGISARADFEEYKSTQNRARFFELEESVTTKGYAATTLFGVAGALAVTSLVLFFVEGKAASTTTAAGGPSRWHVGIAPLVRGGAGVSLDTRF